MDLLSVRAIASIDDVVKTLLAAQNLPRNTRDIFVEDSTLIHAVTRLCPTNKKATVYEAKTGMIPNLDDVPLLICFVLQFAFSTNLLDFKLSPSNQAGVFMGYAKLRHVFGAVIQVGQRLCDSTSRCKLCVASFPSFQQVTFLKCCELSWLLTLSSYSQNKEGSVSSDKSASEMEYLSLYSAESFVEGVGPPEIFLNNNQTYDKEIDINHKEQIALEQLTIPVFEATAKSKADNEDDSFLTLSSLHSQDSSLHVEQNQKIDISRPKHTASTDVIVAPRFTEGELSANRTLLVSRILVRTFGKLGNFTGVLSSYDTVHVQYRIDLSADNKHELISFDDILSLLPNTWLYKRAHACLA